jgi:hypothetical protein
MDGSSRLLLLLLPILVLPPHIMISKLLELHTAPPPPWNGFLEISFIHSILTLSFATCVSQKEVSSQKFTESIHILIYMLTKHAAIQEYHWERDLGFFKTIPDDDCSVRKAPELIQSSKPAAAAVAKLG